MPFKIKYFKDKFIDDNYKKSLDELNQFFGFNWIYNTPKIFIIESRKQFDQLLNRKTENWLVGNASNYSIHLLDRNKFETESDYKYSDEKYIALLKHELCHLFFSKVSNGTYNPKWLNEGTSLYLSNQNKLRKKIPDKFRNFLKFYAKDVVGKDTVYDESGFVVETLVKKFGKKKILNLIKSCSISNTKDKFKKSFKDIYGFGLNYTSLNRLYQPKL
ncbi:MAG: hypothetical protein PHX34_00905 [Candidatus Shapirobacteria bacterium]|nr:hypothetical protein [Candidatus Shapirobacteria bacterium]